MFYFSDHHEILPVVSSFKVTSSVLTELWRQKLCDMTSKFDDVISPSKMSALLWNFVYFLTWFIAIIWTNICEFSYSKSGFTEIPSFTDVVYLWHQWRLPTAYYRRHGPENSAKRGRLISLHVKFQIHIISKVLIVSVSPVQPLINP